MLQRQARKNPGTAREAKDHSCLKALASCCNPNLSQDKESRSSKCWRVGVGEPTGVYGPRDREADANSRGGKQGATTVRLQRLQLPPSCEPRSSWEPEWLGSAKGPTAQDQPPGEMCGCLKRWQPPQDPGTVGTAHTLALSAAPLALPSTAERVSPSKRLFPPPHVW